MAYRSEALDPARHDLRAFDSTEATLDDWLREHASGAAARNVGRSFVWTAEGDQTAVVLGYYTLAGHVIARDALPRSVGRGSPDQVPAVLLGRLALDRTLHGRGLGAALLADVLTRVLLATQQVAARFVVVDALHESAAGFYVQHGFRQVPGSLRLVQKTSDISAALSR